MSHRNNDAGGDSDAATAGEVRNRRHHHYHHRHRGHDGNSNNDTSEEDEAGDSSDPQLNRLLSRLRREHAANAGGREGGGGGVNRTRARYLLEASAGNVGLASALYWEDYLAGAAEGGSAFADARLAAGSGAAAASGDGMSTGGGGAVGSAAGSVASGTSASSTAAVAGRATAAEAASYAVGDLPEYGKRSSPSKRRKGGDGDGDGDDGLLSRRHQAPTWMGSRRPGEAMPGRDSSTSSAEETRKPSYRRQDSTSHRDTSGGGNMDGGSGRDGSLFAPGAAARRHGSTLSSMHQFQQDLDEKISSLQERLSSYRSSLSGVADAERGDDERAAVQASVQAAVASARRAADAAAAARGAPPDRNAPGAVGPGNDDAAAAAAALADYPNLWRMGLEGYPGGAAALGGISPSRYPVLFGGMYAAYGAAGAGGAAAGVASSAAAGGSAVGHGDGRNFAVAMGAALGSTGSDAASARTRGRMEYQSQQGAAAGAAEAAGAQPPPPFDFLSRALAYNPGGAGGQGLNRQLDEAEARALMAALAADPGFAAASAAGGAGGGDDDDDSNGDGNAGDDSPRRDEREQNANDAGRNPRDAVDDDNVAGGGAPLRRSMRLRSARSRAARNPPARNPPRNDRDADSDNDEAPRPRRISRRRFGRAHQAERGAARGEGGGGEGGNPSADVSDDDDVTFLPGPVPVFRLKKGRFDGGEAAEESMLASRSPAGKRKRPDGDAAKLGLYDDSGEGHPDDRPVDVDPLLHASDAYSEPSDELWGSYPCHRSPDGDYSGDDDDENSDRVHIPISWLRSGFTLSECGNGLAVSSLSDDEWERHRRTQSHTAFREGPMKGVRGLFPYNCKGVAALLSIVTALLYSGASVQGGTSVTCDADRVPFDELTKEQRKRDFDSRLVDALSSLIFIAAQAGSRRFAEKLAQYERHFARRRKQGLVTPEEEDLFTTKRLALQRRARVCHVCWWETDTANNNATIYPEGKDPKDVRFKTSFTNVQDLRPYVETHLRSFKEPGGCALLLETILRCHGQCASLPRLLECRCDESVKCLEKGGKRKEGAGSTAMNEVQECLTPQLLSLLLTGEVHSSYENWSADAFGIGLLCMGGRVSFPVGNRLLRPVKPIWICTGDFGYSTLFLEMKDFVGSTDSLEEPGRAFRLAHWNCWTGERTGFRVITSMHDMEPYDAKTVATVSDSEQEGRKVADSISARLHVEQKRDAVMSWRTERTPSAITCVDPELRSISDEELLSVEFHPEDEKYYPGPGQFRRWRFRFGSPVSGNPFMSIDKAGWVPFYRLRGRQRLIVEMKLAPRICAIIRSRWPLATVRDFSPAAKFPVV